MKNFRGDVDDGDALLFIYPLQNMKILGVMAMMAMNFHSYTSQNMTNIWGDGDDGDAPSSI